MIKRKPDLFVRLLVAGFAIFLLVFPVLAQEDPDPNSPTPIVLSEPESTRALTTAPTQFGRASSTKTKSRAFAPNQKAVIYVTNIELLPDEGADAFRIYVEDQQGRQYRFPVMDLQPVQGMDWIYALTFLVKDEFGFWEQPIAEGDLLIGVEWRGLASNRVKLGYGKIGGDLKEDEGAAPTPLSQFIVRPSKTFNESSFKEDGPTDEAVGYRWSSDRIRFLEQATFGPTAALDSRVRRIGLRVWLNEQLTAPYPSANNPYPDIPLMPTNEPNYCNGAENPNSDPPDPADTPVNCRRDRYTMYPVQTWFYKEALYGEPQLRHRVSWALSQIWVISGVDTQQSSHMLAYHKILSNNAFGNWRTLMREMTLNAGMGNYLDMMRSTRTSPNENYAREILQLFNVGLFMLNQNGTLQRDGQNNPIPTYDQNTVNNFTKVFTGWRDCRPADVNASCPGNVNGAPNYKDAMSLNVNSHDLTAKTLFNYPGSTTTNIAACTGCTGAAINTYAYNSLNQALDNIYNHPNVAPFVSKLLIQQLVTSDPTPAYVGRVAAVFNANRTSPTQMKEVVRAILLDPEARGDVKTAVRYGKLREPVQLMTNVLRHFDVASADRSTLSDGNINGLVSNLGQSAFNPPTVFNYYPPDYVVPGTTVLGPEFGIYTTSTAIGRANLMNTLVFSRVNVSNPNTPNGTSINLTELQALAAADATGNQLVNFLNTKMMRGQMSTQMRNTILTAVTAVSATNTLQRAQQALYLVATSSQYQVQR